jgi:hypothetical protein
MLFLVLRYHCVIVVALVFFADAQCGIGLASVNLTSGRPFSSTDLQERFARLHATQVQFLGIWDMPIDMAQWGDLLRAYCAA